MKNVLAFVPARIGSQGIKRKNMQEIGGYKLFEIPLLQAKKSKYINHIVLSTDADEIKSYAKKYSVTIFDRPEEYRYDNTIQEVDRLMLHSLKQYEEISGLIMDIIVLLYPTGPLRSVSDIDQCIDMVASERFNSSLTLAEDHSYLWRVEQDGFAFPTNYKPEERGPRQKEAWNQYIENKAVYAFDRNMFVETGCRIGSKCGAVVMDKMSSVDIDAQEDLDMVRLIVEGRFKLLDI